MVVAKRIPFFRTANQQRIADQAARDYEARRNTESATRHLYWTARWKAKRAEQLSREPLCCRCLVEGMVTPATIANHAVRHNGDPELFWSIPLESVCKSHHDREIQAEERAAASAGCTSGREGGGQKSRA